MRSHLDAVEGVQARIATACAACGRDPMGVGVVVVTKTRTPEEIRSVCDAAHTAGLRVVGFGENRVQEALAKQAAMHDIPLPRWQLVGRLQTNKVKYVSGRFSLVHAFDRVDLIEPYAARAASTPVLLQVNLSGEVTKAGVSASEAPRLLAACVRAGLEVRGFMTMAPEGDLDAAGRVFADLARLRNELRGEFGLPLGELSMGMSDDFDVAIHYGATLVRLGRVLFGERT